MNLVNSITRCSCGIMETSFRGVCCSSKHSEQALSSRGASAAGAPHVCSLTWAKAGCVLHPARPREDLFQICVGGCSICCKLTSVSFHCPTGAPNVADRGKGKLRLCRLRLSWTRFLFPHSLGDGGGPPSGWLALTESDCACLRPASSFLTHRATGRPPSVLATWPRPASSFLTHRAAEAGRPQCWLV